jgi:hypothetical protein
MPAIDAASPLFFVINAAFARTHGAPTGVASAMHVMLHSAHFSVQVVLINVQTCYARPGTSINHNFHALPCIGLSRTGQAGHSICTTSIRPIHSAKGSTLPSGGRKGTPASRTSTAPESVAAVQVLITVGFLVTVVRDELSDDLSEEFIEQFLLIEQREIFAQLNYVQG